MKNVDAEIKRLLELCEKVQADQAENVELAAEHQCAFCGAILSLGEGGVVQGHRIDCEWDCILTTLPEMVDTLEETQKALGDLLKACEESYRIGRVAVSNQDFMKARAALGKEKKNGKQSEETAG